jgi:MtN3 and saliva related transmembrane protein
LWLGISSGGSREDSHNGDGIGCGWVFLLEAVVTPQVAENIGFAAAFLTTAAFVPQLVRVIKLRSARDISLGTFLMYSVGLALWLVYGFYTGSKPVIASNGLALVLSVSILIVKFKYDLSGAKKELEG